MSEAQDYIRIADHIINGTPIKPVIQDFSEKKPPIKLCEIVDGKIKTIILNQSFMKSIFWTGTSTEWIGSWDLRPDACAYRVLKCNIEHAFKYPSSPAMSLGTYFETLCIGSGAYGKTRGLPRNTRTGEIKKNEERILEAVARFKKLADESGILIDERNTQVEQNVPILDTGFPDIQVYLKVVADIISPFKWRNIDEGLAILDLKLTADRHSDFFKAREPWNSFCWSLPDKMSHLQALTYSAVFRMNFINLVFDYKAKDAGFSIIPVKTITSHPNDNEAKLRHREMTEGIKKTVEQLVEWSEWDWPTNKGPHCKKCPVESCEMKKLIEYT